MVYLLRMGGSFHGYVSHNQMVQTTTNWVGPLVYFHDLEFFRPGLALHHFFGCPRRRNSQMVGFPSYSLILCGSKLHVCVLTPHFRWFTAHFWLVPFRYRIFCGVESSNFFLNPPTFLCYKQPNGGFQK